MYELRLESAKAVDLLSVPNDIRTDRPTGRLSAEDLRRYRRLRPIRLRRTCQYRFFIGSTRRAISQLYHRSYQFANVYESFGEIEIAI